MIAYRLDYTIGDWIDNKYRIVKKIGEGNYGNVFLVQDSVGNEYALKLLRLWEVTHELHEPLVEKFELEYKTSNIKSEYLVHSLDFGIVQGNPYLVMEYCSKGDLSKVGQADKSKLKYYARDILEGLHVLHSGGKIHRDLKPENVLIRNNGKAALTDFGVVGEMDKNKRKSEIGFWKQRPKQAQGTPLYMSVDTFYREGGGITYLPTVDIWSFGVMMFELLTDGSFPFGNIKTIEDLPKYFERAKRHEWDSYKLKETASENDWLYIIDKCIMPNYRDRYQNAWEILQDMTPMLGHVANNVVRITMSRSLNISSLIITQGEDMGKSYLLRDCLHNNAQMLRVGREIGNDIVLPEKNSTYVSRFHFTLQRSPDNSFWTIRDGQWKKDERRWVTSTNGTYLNATPVSQEGLRVFTGDIITAGEYKIKVE